MLNVVDGCIPSDMATGSDAEIEEAPRALRGHDPCQGPAAPDPSAPLYTSGQPALGDRYVHAPRSRFIPDPLLPLFDHRVLGAMPQRARAPQGPAKVDVGAELLEMWR